MTIEIEAGASWIQCNTERTDAPGSNVTKPIATPIVGGMITSTLHVLILLPVFFVADSGRRAEPSLPNVS
jgi:multidrug efflux pump subunit AcrB